MGSRLEGDEHRLPAREVLLERFVTGGDGGAFHNLAGGVIEDTDEGVAITEVHTCNPLVSLAVPRMLAHCRPALPGYRPTRNQR